MRERHRVALVDDVAAGRRGFRLDVGRRRRLDLRRRGGAGAGAAGAGAGAARPRPARHRMRGAAALLVWRRSGAQAGHRDDGGCDRQVLQDHFLYSVLIPIERLDLGWPDSSSAVRNSTRRLPAWRASTGVAVLGRGLASASGLRTICSGVIEALGSRCDLATVHIGDRAVGR